MYEFEMQVKQVFVDRKEWISLNRPQTVNRFVQRLPPYALAVLLDLPSTIQVINRISTGHVFMVSVFACRRRIPPKDSVSAMSIRAKYLVEINIYRFQPYVEKC